MTTVAAALLAVVVVAELVVIARMRRRQRSLLAQNDELEEELQRFRQQRREDLPPTTADRVLDVAGTLVKASVGFVADRLLRDDIQRYADADRPLTVMFSDLANSTSLNVELGDKAFAALIRRHDELTGEVVQDAGGKVVKRLGDGFMAVFADPVLAVDAAGRICRSLGDPSSVDRPLLVRLGLHTTTVVSDRGDLYGEGIAKTSRVASLAVPGEVLLTEEAWAAAGEPTAGQPREVALQGLPGPHAVRALELGDRDDEEGASAG